MMPYFEGGRLTCVKMETLMWQRRLAVQLVSQLPEKPSDARKVLRLAWKLYDNFVDNSDGDAFNGPSLDPGDEATID